MSVDTMMEAIKLSVKLSVFKCCRKCSGWMIRDSDTPADVKIKTALTPVAFALGAIAAYGLYGEVFEARKNTTHICAMLILIISFVQFIVRGAFGLDMKRSIDIMIVLILVGVVAQDLYVASEIRTRTWSFVVLLLDNALVWNVPSTIPLVLVVTLLYLIIERSEASLRYGLYDAVASEPPPVCECAQPPCALGMGTGVNHFVTMAIVLLVDFYLTRGFQKDLRHQLRRVRASIDLAAEVAACLARYDVEGAERFQLSMNEDLPDALAKSYRRLFRNLRSYRAYLPHSCLIPMPTSDEEEPGSFNVVTPPPRLRLRPLDPTSPVSLTERLAPSSNFDSGNAAIPLAGSLPVSSPMDASPLYVQGLVTFAHPRPLKTTDRDSHSASLRRQSANPDKGTSLAWSGWDPEMRPSVASSESGFSRARAASETQISLRASVRRARVSLVAANMLGYLGDYAPGELGSQCNVMWISADVEQWCTNVVASKGVVDLIGGDRRYASFNARQVCGEHSSAAVRVLSTRRNDWGSFRSHDSNSTGLSHSRDREPWSGCVVTGQAVCGDFGCPSVLRFMVLGGVASSLHPMERVAAQWRVKVLADGEAFSGCYHWDGKLLGALAVPKRGMVPLRVYSVTALKAREEQLQAAEWMYELASLPVGEHEDANRIKEKQLKEQLDALPIAHEQEEDRVLWRVREVGLFPW
eukprot:Hpha_TRINITY_DN16681_c2_g4::TRINITY_DN16681_c2_g4_i1::g.181215::m.181215